MYDEEVKWLFMARIPEKGSGLRVPAFDERLDYVQKQRPRWLHDGSVLTVPKPPTRSVLGSGDVKLRGKPYGLVWEALWRRGFLSISGGLNLQDFRGVEGCDPDPTELLSVLWSLFASGDAVLLSVNFEHGQQDLAPGIIGRYARRIWPGSGRFGPAPPSSPGAARPAHRSMSARSLRAVSP